MIGAKQCLYTGCARDAAHVCQDKYGVSTSIATTCSLHCANPAVCVSQKRALCDVCSEEASHVCPARPGIGRVIRCKNHCSGPGGICKGATMRGDGVLDSLPRVPSRAIKGGGYGMSDPMNHKDRKFETVDGTYITSPPDSLASAVAVQENQNQILLAEMEAIRTCIRNLRDILGIDSPAPGTSVRVSVLLQEAVFEVGKRTDIYGSIEKGDVPSEVRP